MIVYWFFWFWFLCCFWFCLCVFVLFFVLWCVCGSSLKWDIGVCFNCLLFGVGIDRNVGFLSSECLKLSCCFFEVYYGWWFLRVFRFWWCWGLVLICFCFLILGIYWLFKKCLCNICIVFEFVFLDLRFGDVIVFCCLFVYV